MGTYTLMSSRGFNRRGERVFVSTIRFDPPYDEGLPYQAEAETAVFVGVPPKLVGMKRYRWPEMAEREHAAITVRALR